jgi:hypothetical protein
VRRIQVAAIVLGFAAASVSAAFAERPAGATAVCADGTYSFSIR